MLLSFIISILICMQMFFAHQLWYSNGVSTTYDYNLALSSIGLYFIVVFSFVFISSFSKYNVFLVWIISLVFVLHFATSLQTENFFNFINGLMMKNLWDNLLLKPVFVLLLGLLIFLNGVLCLTFNKIKPRFFNEFH
ncbi:hypothetical protein HMPREF2660_04950 [Weeksella sp. HMSC059D05]|nr:hypothetical protein HMPREF2660_04950 [Weeksella sp. HMSC059D05]SUP53743.1 Uncharacterised protein [Weeksella virosa]